MPTPRPICPRCHKKTLSHPAHPHDCRQNPSKNYDRFVCRSCDTQYTRKPHHAIWNWQPTLKDESSDMCVVRAIKPGVETKLFAAHYDEQIAAHMAEKRVAEGCTHVTLTRYRTVEVLEYPLKQEIKPNDKTV